MKLLIKSIAIAVLIAGAAAFAAGCNNAKAYTVDYCSQKDDYKNARDKYKAGEKVEVYYYLIATDTDYSFYLDGERLNPDYEEAKGYIIRFTMPEHNVKLECQSKNSMIYNGE